MAVLQLVCASADPDKVLEIAAILDGVVDLVPRPADVPEVVEDADSLVGNARLKAMAICAATGLPAVSDDTGLFVDALDGAPGVYAARFAGDDATYADNRLKLLSRAGGSHRPWRQLRVGGDGRVAGWSRGCRRRCVQGRDRLDGAG